MLRNALLSLESIIFECQRRHISVAAALRTDTFNEAVYRKYARGVRHSECHLDTAVMEIENQLAFAETPGEQQRLNEIIEKAKRRVLPVVNYVEFCAIVPEVKRALDRFISIASAYVWALEPGNHAVCRYSCCDRSRNNTLHLDHKSALARDTIADVMCEVSIRVKTLAPNLTSSVYFGDSHAALSNLVNVNECGAYIDDIVVLQLASRFFLPRANRHETENLDRIRTLARDCYLTRKPTRWRKMWIGRGSDADPLIATALQGDSRHITAFKTLHVTAGRALLCYALKNKLNAISCPAQLLPDCRRAFQNYAGTRFGL